jgi:hypothetical protein
MRLAGGRRRKARNHVPGLCASVSGRRAMSAQPGL